MKLALDTDLDKEINDLPGGNVWITCVNSGSFWTPEYLHLKFCASQ